MQTRSLADAIVEDHVVYAMGAALIPLPLVDVAAVTAVQVEMVRTLARAYSVPWDDSRGRALVFSLAGASLARAGASAVKALPLAGSLAGGAAQLVLSGASTYAVGQVFCASFAERGSLEDLDAQALRSRYADALDRGRDLARALFERTLGEPEPSLEELGDELERLGRLRSAGVITPDEFERLKAALLRR